MILSGEDKNQTAWIKLFGLDSERMNLKNGALTIKFFNEDDYGSYECVLVYDAYNNRTKKYASQFINLTRDATRNITIDRFR